MTEYLLRNSWYTKNKHIFDKLKYKPEIDYNYWKDKVLYMVLD